MSCKAGLVVLNSLSFCLSVKVLISPLNLNEILAGYINLDCKFFPFITLYELIFYFISCNFTDLVDLFCFTVELLGFFYL